MIPIPLPYGDSAEPHQSQAVHYPSHRGLSLSSHSDRSEWLDESTVSIPQGALMSRSRSDYGVQSYLHSQSQRQLEGFHLPSNGAMPSHLPPPNPGRESPSEDRNGEEAPWENDSSQGDQPQLTSVRVGKACIPCRSRKVKCEGSYPHCRLCLEKGRTDECFYRIIPPRSITRKGFENLETRLHKTEVQLKASQEENQKLKSLLVQAEKELESYRKGEKTQELERRLRELELRLEPNQNLVSQEREYLRRSSDQSGLSHRSRRPPGSMLESPSLQSQTGSEKFDAETLYRSDHFSNQSFRSANSLGSVEMESRSHVGRVANRRRATSATTSLTSNFNYAHTGSVGREKDGGLRINRQEQCPSSWDLSPYRSQSLSRSPTSSEFHSHIPNSIPPISPPLLDLFSNWVSSSSFGNTSPATVASDSHTMESGYLSSPFFNSSQSPLTSENCSSWISLKSQSHANHWAQTSNEYSAESNTTEPHF